MERMCPMNKKLAIQLLVIMQIIILALDILFAIVTSYFPLYKYIALAFAIIPVAILICLKRERQKVIFLLSILSLCILGAVLISSIFRIWSAFGFYIHPIRTFFINGNFFLIVMLLTCVISTILAKKLPELPEEGASDTKKQQLVSAEELDKLFELYQQGSLSKEEYEEIKKKFL